MPYTSYLPDSLDVYASHRRSAVTAQNGFQN
jgi:hypothetical protein